MTTLQRYKSADQASTSRLLFIMCWIAYCTAYIGRINYSAALVGIISEGVFTKSQAGLIGTVYFFCYGGGQLINGFFGDRVSPYKMVLTGLSVSACANLIMPAASASHITMAVVWGVNGLAQSMIWAPILYIISNVLDPQMRKKACLYIASSVPVGTLLAYLISMLTIAFFDWKMVFVTASVIMFAVAGVWVWVSLRASKILVSDHKIVLPESEQPRVQKTAREFRKLLTSSGAIMIAFAMLLHGMLKDGVNSWVPTMINESYPVSASFSIFLTMILPIINLSGAYISTYLYQKYFHHNEMKTAAVCFAFAVLPLGVLLLLGVIPVYICVVMLALFTTSMLAFNHMTITLVPVRFAAYNKASTITGLFNSIIYGGCAVSNYGFGYLSEKLGWQKTLLFWILLAVLALVFCLLSLKPWQRFIHSVSQEAEIVSDRCEIKN